MQCEQILLRPGLCGIYYGFPPLLICCLLKSPYKEFEDDMYYKNAGWLSVLEKSKYESFSDCTTWICQTGVVPFGVRLP